MYFCFPLGVALGYILTSVVSDFHFGKRPGARDMTTLGSHFLPHVTENVLLSDDIFTTRPYGHLQDLTWEGSCTWLVMAMALKLVHMKTPGSCTQDTTSRLQDLGYKTQDRTMQNIGYRSKYRIQGINPTLSATWPLKQRLADLYIYMYIYIGMSLYIYRDIPIHRDILIYKNIHI